MHVAYYAPFCQQTGYAQAAHDYMLALHRAGVSLEIVPLVECDTDCLESRYGELISLAVEPADKKVTHRIIHTVPRGCPQFVGPRDGTQPLMIAITTWETDKMPDDMVQALDCAFDSIVVPSDFCKTTLGPAMRDKTHVVPHTFDPEHWEPPDCPPADSPFVFYSILGWHERKNPIGLLKAYLSEFSSNDDVLLRMKVSGSYNTDDLAALAHASGFGTDDLPAIEIITDYFDEDDLLLFHHEGHAFVTAARGEGWNLPAFEAALCGKPVISPNWGGQMQYLKDYCNFVGVPSQMTPVYVPPQVAAPVDFAGLPIRPIKSIAPSGIAADQYWAEPDLYFLAGAMRRCYESRMPVDLSDRDRLESTYGYKAIGQQLASLLERTVQGP